MRQTKTAAPCADLNCYIDIMTHVIDQSEFITINVQNQRLAIKPEGKNQLPRVELAWIRVRAEGKVLQGMAKAENWSLNPKSYGRKQKNRVESKVGD